MRWLIILVVLSCNAPAPAGHKYYLKLELERGSTLQQSREIEYKTDSIIAPSDVAAFDSLIATVYGWQYADSVLKDGYIKLNALDNYNWERIEVKAVKLYNQDWTEITNTIPDSVKQQSILRWRIKHPRPVTMLLLQK